MDTMLFNRIVVGVFLLLTLLLGLSVKRAKTLKEYALANRSLNTGVLTLSLLATFVASGDLSTPYYIAKGDTISNFVEGFFFLLTFFLIGLFLAPKMVHFRDCMTAGDVMEQLYGRVAKIITGILGLGLFLLVASAQMRFIGNLTSRILGVSPEQAIVFISLFVILYSAIGGMRSVAITDVAQFIALAVVLIVLTNVLIYKVKGLKAVFTALPAEKTTICNNSNLTYSMVSATFWGLFPAFLLSPPVVQRMLMTKHKREAQKMFFTGGVFYGAIKLLLTLIGLIAWVYYEEKSEKIDENLLPNLLGELFVAQPRVQILLTLGLVCVLISTIDSYIIATSVSFVRDFIPSTKEKSNNSLAQMKIAQLLTVLVGGLAIGITIFFKDPFGRESYYYVVILSAIFLVPFILGVFGFKIAKNAFWAFVIPYSGTFLITRILFGIHELYEFFPSLVAGLLSYFIHHYYVHKGFVITSRSPHLFVVQTWRPSWGKTWEGVKKIVSIPLKLAQTAREKVAIYGSEPLRFSMFILLINMVVNGSTPDHFLRTFYLTSWIQLGSALLCVGLMLRALWPSHLEKAYFPLYWFFAIFFCIPFSHFLLFLDDPTNPIAVIKLTVMLFLLIVLVDWRSFFFLLSIGIGSALAVRYFLAYPAPAELPMSAKFQIAWGTIPALAIGLFFARKKEQAAFHKTRRLTQAKEENEARFYVQRNVHEQLAMAVDARSSVMREVQTIADKLKGGVLEREDGYKLEKVLAYLSDTQRISMDYLPLEPIKRDWKEVIHALFRDLETLQLEEKVEVLLHLAEENGTLVADMPYIHRLLINALQHRVKYHPTEDIYCHIDEVALDYGLDGKQKAIPAHRITISPKATRPIAKLYHPSSFMPNIEHDAKHLSENYRITMAHYGSMCYECEPDNCVQSYVIPCDVHQVRPKVKPLTDENIQQVSLDAPEDTAFLQATDVVNMHVPMVEKALRICKHYHRFQKRKSGEPYYLHPVAVATILLDYTKDVDVVVAGLLHDIIEDTPYTADQMAASFNANVAHIVGEVSNIYGRKSRKLKLAKQEKFAKMLQTADPRSLLVKLADRLHNMRTLASRSEAKRIAVAQETIDFFIPIAKHLGRAAIVEELTRLCEQYV